MADFSEDRMLAHAFADLRREVGPEVRPVGVGAVHATVRHRRRTRATVIAAVAAVVVLVPAAAYAMLANAPHRGPQVGTTGTPTSTPSSTPSPSIVAAPPDGRFTKDDLRNISLDIPAWGPDANRHDCPSGRVTFTNWIKGVAEDVTASIGSQGYADVDGDGAQETLVLVRCNDDSVGTEQVIALDRDASGAVRTIGQVVAQSGTVRTICGARPAPGDGVDVQVVDFALSPVEDCTPKAAPWAIFQWRTYGFDGAVFRQTAGATSFPRNPKVGDLAVNATNITFPSPDPDGVRHATMSVTVRNLGPSAVPYSLTLQVSKGVMVISPGGCQVDQHADGHGSNQTCPFSPVAPGTAKTITFQLTSDSTEAAQFQPRVLVNVPSGYADTNLGNDSAAFTITYD